jgi:ATP-dependent helicase/nuclease subunit B
MHALLARFGIKRRDVEILGRPARGGREVLASEAMRPSNATAEWYDRLKLLDISAQIAAGMDKLAVIEAANPEMEALAIAVAMREARHLDKSVALVTPDRALARRVMAALGRWNLEVNDSGGDQLMETSAGIFARLAAQAVTSGLEPPILLALLKHPLLRLGYAQNALRRGVEVLEQALLRGTRPQAGSNGLARDLAGFREELRKLRNEETSVLHRAEPRTRLRDPDLDEAERVIKALQATLAPLEGLTSSSPA